MGGAAAAEVVGGTDLRAAADAEEKKSDCGKAAVSSGELGSSQDPTGRLTVSGSCGSTSEQEDL